MARWGQARVEVLALRQEIKDELIRGVPVKQIYDMLVERGYITVTYNGFRRQVQPIRDDLRRAPVEVSAPPNTLAKAPTETSVSPLPSERPELVKGKPKKGFAFNPVSKAEDFF
ncbi:MAG: hypothetical protein HQ504_01045 [Rhodospirillaceae bacterium]|nr:hypothetical protein [Rhodospirillaceae bacterium]